MKIAMIGAGSIIFCKTLLNDMLATPALQGATFALMSPTETKLRRMEAFAQRMVRENGLPAQVYATTERREAIRDADYVISMVQVGGVDAFKYDLRDPAEIRRGSVHRRLTGPRRRAARAAQHAGAGGDCQRHGGACCAGRHFAQLHQPDGRASAMRWARSPTCPSSACATGCRPRSI